MEKLKPSVRYRDLANGDFGPERVSDWFTISQEDITRFGLLTRDPDPHHIDADWAAANSPFGKPIAFGFQSLAMLTYLINSAGAVPKDATHVVNYGFDQLRWVAPVPAGSRIRGRFTIANVKHRKERQILVRYAATVEIEHGEKPALVAEWLALYEGESV